MDDDLKRMLNDVLKKIDQTPRMVGGQYVFPWSERWSQDGSEVLMTEEQNAICVQAEPDRHDMWWN